MFSVKKRYSNIVLEYSDSASFTLEMLFANPHKQIHNTCCRQVGSRQVGRQVGRKVPATSSMTQTHSLSLSFSFLRLHSFYMSIILLRALSPSHTHSKIHTHYLLQLNLSHSPKCTHVYISQLSVALSLTHNFSLYLIHALRHGALQQKEVKACICPIVKKIDHCPLFTVSIVL